jgi:cysteine desulfurase
MAANNETGVLQPWPEVRGLCREAGALFLCDATQWLGKLPSAGLGECDFVFASVHKCGGPRGIGFWTLPANTTVRPLLLGGGQEDGRRAGTENLPGILAATAALETREWQIVADEAATRRAWRDDFEKQLVATLPGTQVVGALGPRLWNTSCAILPPLPSGARWEVKLDELGFAVSSGADGARGQATPSPVLTAMGYADGDAARAVRFSAGWETTEADWQALSQTCQHIWRECGADRPN